MVVDTFDRKYEDAAAAITGLAEFLDMIHNVRGLVMFTADLRVRLFLTFRFLLGFLA